MEWIRFVITAALVLSGLFFCAVGVLGLFRFKYAANRMHAAAVVDTLGISLCMAGFAVSAPDLFSGLKILLVIVFWWLSSPVASHLLCRLEIVTDEQRSEYMTVHMKTIRQEREAAEAAICAAADAVNMEEMTEEKTQEATMEEEAQA